MRIVVGALGVAMLLSPTTYGSPDLVGQLTERVVCQSSPTQSYALYVPSRYNPQQTWPVILCFDALARGRVPVERLRDAAERYGYLVAGSLDSRNGPWEDNATAIEAMLTDVQARFVVDRQRIYAAGMSGGARVATRIAMAGVAHGVIACGAGFPVATDAIPPQVTFPYFGAAGTEDFNYPEMRRVGDALERRGAAHRIVIFPGGHEWAPTGVLTEAVEWLELQAMRTGKRRLDPAFLQAQWQARLVAVPTAPELDRWRALKSLVADFATLVDVSGAQQSASELGRSRAVKEAVRAEQASFAREEEMINELGNVAIGRSLQRKRSLAAELRRRADAPSDSAERRRARRVIASYFSIAHETLRDLRERNEHARAAAMLEMSTALRPDRPRLWVELARERALSGDQPEALDALTRAVDIGFDEVCIIDDDPAFVRCRGPRLQALMAQIAVNAADPVVALPELHIGAALAWMDLQLVFGSAEKSGLRLLSYLRVVDVRPGTRAAAAGVRAGMQVTAIQGVRINGLTEPEFLAAMDRPLRSELIVNVRDHVGGKETELRFPLQRARQPE